MSVMTPEEEKEYLQDRARKIEQLKAREEQRKKAEPFKTMAVVSHSDTINALRGWREPSTAYVLFEIPALHNTGNGGFRWGAKICTINIEHRPEQESRFYYLIRKGGRPIHYANFPKASDNDSRRLQLYKMHTGPDGINPFDEMARLVDRTIRRNEGTEQEIAEKRGLEAKLEIERENVRRLKEELEAKNEGNKPKTRNMATPTRSATDSSGEG